MRSLKEHIKETMESLVIEASTARFNQPDEIPADPKEWLTDFYSKRGYHGNQLTELVEAVAETLSKITANSAVTAVLSEDESVKYFKIPYVYAAAIREVSKTLDSKSWTVKFPHGEKCQVSYNPSHGREFEVFETGKGSKCIGTPFQEILTCITYNMVVAGVSSDEIDNQVTAILAMDSSASASCFNKNGGLNAEGKRWLNSWKEHAKLINEYVNNSNTMAIRYSSGSTLASFKKIYNEYICTVNENLGLKLPLWDKQFDSVLKAYNDALTTIMTDQNSGTSQKDHIDKSDIFVITTNDTSDVIKTFTAISGDNYKDAIPGLRKLIKDKTFVGVSLKKTGSEGHLDSSSDKMVNSVSDVNIVKPVQSSGAKYANECRVQFTVNNQKRMLITVRSFGGKGAACDIKEIDDNGRELIALGKVPVNLLRNIIATGSQKSPVSDAFESDWQTKIFDLLGSQKSKYCDWDAEDITGLSWDANDATEDAWKFLAVCAYNNDTEDILKRMANAALATTEYCFPFVIIH